MQLRASLSETCEYLLRTVGVRESSSLDPLVAKHHGRQIELLSRLLKKSWDTDD